MQEKQAVFNVALAIEKQRELCDRIEVPQFAPSDGRCVRCGRNIYDAGGVSVEQARTKLITVCPWCGGSFVE